MKAMRMTQMLKLTCAIRTEPNGTFIVRLLVYRSAQAWIAKQPAIFTVVTSPSAATKHACHMWAVICCKKIDWCCINLQQAAVDSVAYQKSSGLEESTQALVQIVILGSCRPAIIPMFGGIRIFIRISPKFNQKACPVLQWGVNKRLRPFCVPQNFPWF